MCVLRSFCSIETCGILEGYSVRAPSLHCEVSGELEAELPYFLLYLFLKGLLCPFVVTQLVLASGEQHLPQMVLFCSSKADQVFSSWFLGSLEPKFITVLILR